MEEGIHYTTLTDIIYQTLKENAQCAHEGGTVAAVARRELESKTGKNIDTPLDAREFFEIQREAKKEQLYLPIRNFILGTGLFFGSNGEGITLYKSKAPVLEKDTRYALITTDI